MNNLRKNSQNGDTIVEVLLAVAVISSMLVGAFSIANKSSSQIRMAQERTEATKLTTSVLEQLKKDSGVLTDVNKWYCYDPSTYSFVLPSSSETALADLPVYGSSADTASSYNSNCKYSYNNGVEYFSFVKFNDDSSGKVFTVVSRWDRAGGGREQQEMIYRGE